jgi:anti-sigma factor RsiW
MTPDALTCPELAELVTDYLEESLPAPQRKRFEAHLRDCESCEDDLDRMRATLKALGSFPEESLTLVAKHR